MTSKIVSRATRYFPVENGEGVSVTYLLKEGMAGDYAVYAGVGSDEFVLLHGTKLSQSEGREYFGAEIDQAGLRCRP